MAEMKKSLFALAALSTFSGALSAQSNLTIYGVIDIAYLNEKSRSNINSQANASAIINSPEQLSRLGFRGTEDFGGGIKAFFVAESVISAANASLSDW
ncbi:MAG: porin, partial [Chitinophagia bacterium]|nr:porin [Chitinophagia bacterium]